MTETRCGHPKCNIFYCEHEKAAAAKKNAIIRVTKIGSMYYVTVEYKSTGIQVGEYSSLRAAADYADRHLQLVSNMFGIRAEIALGSEK